MAFTTVIREINVDGVQYGMWVEHDIDTGLYKIGYYSSPWKWQDYISRNKKNLRRRIKVKKTSALYTKVKDAFREKYVWAA